MNTELLALGFCGGVVFTLTAVLLYSLMAVSGRASQAEERARAAGAERQP